MKGSTRVVVIEVENVAIDFFVFKIRMDIALVSFVHSVEVLLSIGILEGRERRNLPSSILVIVSHVDVGILWMNRLLLNF